MAAAERFGIRYPVVQDNEKHIWRRYGIWAWPTLLLVDKQGIIRYRHIGEGDYAAIEATIQACWPRRDDRENGLCHVSQRLQRWGHQGGAVETERSRAVIEIVAALKRTPMVRAPHRDAALNTERSREQMFSGKILERNDVFARICER